REGVLGDSRRVGAPRVGEQEVALLQLGNMVNKLDAGAWRLNPAKLPGSQVLVARWVAKESVGVGNLPHDLFIGAGADEVNLGIGATKPVQARVVGARAKNDLYHVTSPGEC